MIATPAVLFMTVYETRFIKYRPLLITKFAAVHVAWCAIGK